MDFKKIIKDELKKNKPDIKDNSLKTYTSIINTFMKNNNIEDINIFKNDENKIIKILEDIAYDKRKTILSALIALVEKDSDAQTKYKKMMIGDINKYKYDKMKQQKSDKEKENWISQEDVLDVYKKLEKNIHHLWTKDTLTKLEFQRLQDYVILSCYVLIPPRRLLDYTEFVLNGETNQKNNGFNPAMKVFTFQVYKTANYYGTQNVELPKKLLNIVRRWKRINTNKYMFIDIKGNKLTSVKLNQRLNKIFNKKISASMLRKIYITDVVLKDVPKLNELQDIAEDMGHSVNQQVLYARK